MIENWDIKLAQYIESNASRPFIWGEWDCCIFTANGIKLITGIDYMAEFRGKYSSQQEAIEILGGSLLEVLKAKFGPLKKVGMRGDIAFRFDVDGPCIGLCFGEGSLFLAENKIEVIESAECRFFGVSANG